MTRLQLDHARKPKALELQSELQLGTRETELGFRVQGLQLL